MMNLHTLDTTHPGKIRALFGLTPVALSQLLEAVLPVMIERRQQAQASRPDRKRRVGGGRKRRLRPYQEVLMSLLLFASQRIPRVGGATVWCECGHLRKHLSRSGADSASGLPHSAL